MKKIALTLATVLTLGACGGTGGGLGDLGGNAGNIAKTGLSMYINSQCSAQLNELTAWRTARALMSSQQEREWESKICGCVSEEAPNHLSLADGYKLATESGRTELFANVVSKTASTCFTKLYSK